MLLITIGPAGEYMHRRRWHGSSDRHHREHPRTPGESQKQSMRSVKLDVQTSRRIGVGVPYHADGRLLVCGYHLFRMHFTALIILVNRRLTLNHSIRCIPRNHLSRQKRIFTLRASWKSLTTGTTVYLGN
jgi:hypothetical protein